MGSNEAGIRHRVIPDKLMLVSNSVPEYFAAEPHPKWRTA